MQQDWFRNALNTQTLTTARIAIGAAAIAAENRADDRLSSFGRRLSALSEADRLWEEALGYLGDEADHWSRRCVK